MNSYNKFTKIGERTLIVGIDIGKEYHYGFMRTISIEDFKPFAFKNSLDGFECLLKRIIVFKKAHQVENVIVAFESTGTYWIPFVYYVTRQTDYTVLQVNSKHTKRFKDVTDNTTNKTDQKDPRIIAQIIIIGSGLHVCLPTGAKADLRELTRMRQIIMENRKRVINQLESTLSVHFPELGQVFKDLSCKTCLFLLKETPTPDAILKMPEEVLIKELRRISNGRIDQNRSKLLISLSKRSAGVKYGLEAYLVNLKILLAQLDLYICQIKEIEKRVTDILKTLNEYNILRSINGLGHITMATIISEVVDFNNFKTDRELLKFAGLNLVENSSGKHHGNRRISKIGNKFLRTSIFFATLRLITKRGVYHDIYQTHLNKGMSKKKAVIAISRKLIRTIHAMIRKNEKFTISHEIKNYKNVA
jgi:transposase